MSARILRGAFCLAAATLGGFAAFHHQPQPASDPAVAQASLGSGSASSSAAGNNGNKILPDQCPPFCASPFDARNGASDVVQRLARSGHSKTAQNPGFATDIGTFPLAAPPDNCPPSCAKANDTGSRATAAQPAGQVVYLQECQGPNCNAYSAVQRYRVVPTPDLCPPNCFELEPVPATEACQSPCFVAVQSCESPCAYKITLPQGATDLAAMASYQGTQTEPCQGPGCN